MARVFKTKSFARDARKARIRDDELCRVISKAAQGQITDLGGRVFKARLNKNAYRSIILARGRGDRWFYQYLFAKKDRENIDEDELEAFRLLADGYAKVTGTALKALIRNGDLIEICRTEEDEENDDEAENK
jgi:hypothetical protein